MTDRTTRTTVLTDDDHRHFIEHGYVVLRGLIPSDVLDAAVTALDRMPSDLSGPSGPTPVYHDDIPEVRDSVPLDIIERAATEIAGPEIHLSRPPRLVHVPRPYTADASLERRFHIDLVHPTLTPDTWALNTIVFLTRVRPGGGAFLFSPGSPGRLRTAMVRSSPGVVFGPDGSEQHQEGVPHMEYLAEPGDVFIYSYLLSHSASRNRTDPQTRHMFGGGIWSPADRLELHRKPIEEMSTLERASSTKHARLLHPDVPDLRPVAHAPSSPACTRIRSHVTVRLDGRLHVFLAVAESPSLVRHLHTTDWATWEESSPIDLGDGTAVTRLSVGYRGGAHLLVSVLDDAGGARVRSLALGESFEHWTDDAARAAEGALVAEWSYAHPSYGSRDAWGSVDFTVPADDPTHLDWHSLGDWGDAMGGTVVRIDGDRRITDLLLKASLPVQHCLVLETEGPDGGREVICAHSAITDVFSGPFHTLAVDDDRPIRNLRLQDRARGYWLVTYVVAGDGGDKLEWGTIDWEADGVLHPIRDAAALESALGVVGLV